MGPEVHSDHMIDSRGKEPSSLGRSKSHLINIKDLFIALLTGNSKGFRDFVPEMEQDQIYTFLITNHNLTATHLHFFNLSQSKSYHFIRKNFQYIFLKGEDFLF